MFGCGDDIMVMIFGMLKYSWMKWCDIWDLLHNNMAVKGCKNIDEIRLTISSKLLKLGSG